ncbi:septation protein SepH [Williamsia sp.]|uniref:septation protein SepH n=1 Tax=Williamsia sp. TaxID=1872085 RepID=UPI002F91EC42
MRELRVIGLEPDGKKVICQDTESGEKFRIPADDTLRAAARGDLTRMGQIEIEMESTLRPREIQARIRAGATVAQVAAAAGVPANRVERFAHPVLLERSRAAELAAAAHPLRYDGPALSTLGEVVAAALGARGHNPDDTEWDAWKAEDNRWIVQVSWRVGRSVNRAHWRYLPGSNSGTVEAIDEVADELIDPDLSRPLRSVAPVPPMVDSSDPDHPELSFDYTPPKAARVSPISRPARLTVKSDGSGEVTVDADSLTGEQRARRTPRPLSAQTRQQPSDNHIDPVDDADNVPTVTADAADVDPHDVDPTPETTRAPESPAPQPGPKSPEVQDKSDANRKRGRGSRKPSVPAWEDVLLGVRSSGNP